MTKADYKYHHFESYIGREEAPMKVRVSYLASAKTGRTSPNDWAMLDDMIVCPFAGDWQGVDLSEALSPETLERIQREALRHYMDFVDLSEALSPETLERIQREALRHYMDLMEVES